MWGMSEQGASGILWSVFEGEQGDTGRRIASFADRTEALAYIHADFRITELEKRIAELEEDARSARRERDDAIRQRDEMDTEAQRRAGRYCREKREAERERDEARAALTELREIIDAAESLVLGAEIKTGDKDEILDMLAKGGV